MTADICCCSSDWTTLRLAAWRLESARRAPRPFSDGPAKYLKIRCATVASLLWLCPERRLCKVAFRSSSKTKSSARSASVATRRRKMRISPRLEPQVQLVQSQIDVVARGVELGVCEETAAGYSFASLFRAPQVCSMHERHARRPGWTDLFFDLVFAAAIAQLSAPLDHDYSFFGIGRFAFLLALVFLAWFGYTAFATQFVVDDVVQRALLVMQIFLVAVMAANATDALSSRDAAGFGAAYGGVRAILALQYARVIRLPETATLVRRRIIGLVSAAILWTAAALLPAPQRYAGWVVALLIDIGNSWP